MKYFSFILLTIIVHACKSKPSADIIVHHALVYTINNEFDTVQAFAVKDGKIIATGTNESILNKYIATQSINAQGMPVYPGFIDAHSHFIGYGQSLFTVNLYGVKTWDEAITRVEVFAAAHPQEKWIKGGGWDQNLFLGKSYPTNEQLNKLFPNIPVFLSRVDGHAAMVNDAALRLAHIIPGQSLTGGKIETFNGRLTGLLIDNAVSLINAVMPASTIADYTKWLTAAQANCFAAGLTTVSDCGLMYTDVQAIDTLQRQHKINMRVYVMLTDDTANYRRYLRRKPYKTDKLFVKGIKLYADGALGSRGACLLQPYNDQKNWFGFLLKNEKYYDSIAAIIAATDYQLCTHAIGDSANRMVLDIYNRLLRGPNDRRWRIEHAQVVNSADVSGFGRTSVIPSVQPTHATSDMAWAPERLGPARMHDAYAYQSLLQQNGWLPLGTDFPIEDISPVKTFYAAVVRKDTQGRPTQGFQVFNALTRQQALRGITIWAAKACFLEKEIGSIEPGKTADFVILSSDLMKTGEKELLSTKVLATYSKGRLVK